MNPGYSMGKAAAHKNIVAWVALFLSQAALAQQPEVQFLRAWEPAEGSALAEASGLALAPDGTVLIVERNRGALWRIAGETPTSVELAGKDRPFGTAFGAKKTGGVAWLGPNRIAVANTSTDTVAIVDPQGKTERVFAGGGRGDGQLKDPEGLAFSARKRLYVADRSNNRVAVFSEDGVFLHSIGGAKDAALQRPVHVAVDGAERVYVLEDAGAGRLSVFDHSGKMLKRVPAESLPGGRNARWRALAVDAGGRVFIGDSANGNIAELDWERARVRRSFGSPGKGRGQFAEVTALAIAGRDLAVVDTGNRKIEFFRVPELKVPVPNTERLASVRRGKAQGSECERVYALDGGDLLCLDARNGRVARLDAAGKPKLVFPARLERPRRAAIDARDIAVADGDSVKIFAHDGKLRFSIGRGGSRDGEFSDIGGLHLAEYIYVADTGNRRVQMFTRDGIFVKKLVETEGQNQPRRFSRPTAVVTDVHGNIYIADAETKSVQVFSGELEWRRALGSWRGYEAIHGLSIDPDGRLYVLAATERSKQTLDVYYGTELEFSFSAYRTPQIAPSDAATLSMPLAGYDLALHDAERKELAIYHYLQAPHRVGGVEVRGEPAAVRVAWRKAPERYVTGYRVYAAAERDGAYERVLETQALEAALDADAAKRFQYYRVSAYTGLGVEGESSADVEDPFRPGFREFEAGRHEAAVAALTRALQAAPDHATSVEYLGRSLLALGRHDAAVAQFQELARRPGRETVARRLEATAIAAAGDALGARAVVERAIATAQADPETFLLCGELSLQLADPTGAARCLETAIAKQAGGAAARAMLGEAFVRMGAVDKGLAELDAATAAVPPDVAAWRRAARVFQGLGRHRDALARYARVLELAPRDADALIATATLHLALGEFDRARTIALSLVGSPAQESRGQYLVGRIAMAQTKPEDAIVAFSRATRLDASHGAAWAGLADAYVALKDESKARDALAKAAALPNAGADVFRRLAELESKGGRHAAALAALERAVVLAPGESDLRLAQARTLAALERWQECGNAAREALRLSPRSADALLLSAEAAHRQGKNGEAIETLKRALVLQPESYELHFKLGRSYAENNLYNDAETHLERAAQLDSRSDAPHLLLGQVQLERRAYDAAIAALTQALNLNASDANRRKLDTAYALKKKSQSGTAGRVAIGDLRLGRVFAAAHKQYASEPLGRVKVSNDSAEDYKGLRVSFFIKEYMDYPVTQDLAELKAKSSAEVPLLATFNNKVLGIDEDTRVLVVVTLAMPDARDGTQEITQAMTLYGKNAIVWANDSMIGSFVTPRDDTLRNFVREAVNRYGPPSQGALNRPLAQAAAVFNTLAGHGMRYQPDPNTPYSRVSADQVDYVQFPRETLKLKSGDCDDLSVLLAAAYENLGIETALVEVPGHLFMMFRTGLKEADRGLISLQDELLVVRDGEVWIPVEATLIATSFSEAWAEGARRYREAAGAKQAKVLALRQAWERYPPAALAPTALAVEVPSGERVARLIEREQRLLIARRLEREVVTYRQTLAANPKDTEARLQIGTIYARNGVIDVAQKEFDAILEQNPRHVGAHNNRGNLYFNRGDFERALDAYRYAEELDSTDGGIRLNAALAYYRLGKLSEAQTKFREATQLKREISAEYRAFAKLLGN